MSTSLKNFSQLSLAGPLIDSFCHSIVTPIITTLCRYDSIRDMEIAYARDYFRSVVSSQFPTFLSSMDAEDLSRYADIISHLVARLAS